MLETPIVVAMVAGIISFMLGILNLVNQRKLEAVRKSVSFETLRFEKLHDVKNEIIDLSDKNKHSVELILNNRDNRLSQEESLQAVMLYQEKQVVAVSDARSIFRRHKHLLDNDIRAPLDEMVSRLETSGKIGMHNEVPTELVSGLLEERIHLLEEFIPEFERAVSEQLDRSAKSLSKA